MGMQSKYLWGSGLSAGLLALAMLLPGARFATTSSSAPSGRFISVTGSALVTVSSATTSRINVNLNVNSVPTAAAAEVDLTKEIGAVRSAVEKLGVPQDHISVNTQSRNLAGGRNPTEVETPNAGQTLLITTPRSQAAAVFDAIGTALAPFAGHGNYYVYAGPGLASSALNAPASGLDRALAEARKEATTVAKAMETTLGPIQSVTQESFNGNSQQNPNLLGITVQVTFATRG